MSDRILGIEIGGTKLQFGVGDANSADFTDFERVTIDRSRGAEGILQQIQEVGGRLVSTHQVNRVGYGFGGPVNRQTGQVVTSHQVEGWTDFPLQQWTLDTLGVPAVLGNDCDVATLAEAILGAGKGHRTVFYVTVGTGIGGGLVIDGALHGSDRPAVAEIGHLRPGPQCVAASETVESIASGLGLENALRTLINDRPESDPLAAIFHKRCAGNLSRLSGQMLSDAAEQGNALAVQVLEKATRTLGWAIAQTITLTAPDIVIVGGGVSMMPEDLFLRPVESAVKEYSFGPLLDQCPIVLPELGEEVVVHGAILNARSL